MASVQAQQMTMQAIAIQQQMMSSFPPTPAGLSSPPSLRRQVHGSYSSRWSTNKCMCVSVNIGSSFCRPRRLNIRRTALLHLHEKWVRWNAWCKTNLCSFGKKGAKSDYPCKKIHGWIKVVMSVFDLTHPRSHTRPPSWGCGPGQSNERRTPGSQPWHQGHYQTASTCWHKHVQWTCCSEVTCV